MSPDVTRDDISFLKRVSEEARYAPLLGGRYLVMWGSVVTVAYLCQYLILSGTLGWPQWTILPMWAVVMAVAAVCMALFGRTMARKPGNQALSNQVEKWVWTSAGFGIGAYAAGTFFAVALSGAPTLLFDLIVAVALAGYGGAFLVVSHISGQTWMRRPAIGSFVGAGIIPFYAGTHETYLVGAGIIFAVAVLPGLVLLRAEPATLPREA